MLFHKNKFDSQCFCVVDKVVLLLTVKTDFSYQITFVKVLNYKIMKVFVVLKTSKFYLCLLMF